jgi:hypothetical protein
MNSMPEVKRKRGRPPKVLPVIDSPPENPIVKRKPGRPRKDECGFNYVLGLARIGLSDAEIQKKLSMSRATWYRLLAQGANHEALNAIRVSGKDDVKSAIFERALHGDVAACRLAISWLHESGRNSRATLAGAAFVGKKG